jgi:glucose-1-phosphate thymidylyltransferase
MMTAGIREILIVSTPDDLPRFEDLLGSGARLGLRIAYAEQPEPRGAAEALIIGEQFAGGAPVCLILGDNVFHGPTLPEVLRRAVRRERGAHVFGYRVRDPRRYSVPAFDAEGRVVSIEEKPPRPRSDQAIVGMYFYDGRAAGIARELEPSARGELEIAGVNNAYLERGELTLELLGRDTVWFDTGTPDSLIEAAGYVKAFEDRTGRKVACIEETAYRMGFIEAPQLQRLAEPLKASGYGRYLLASIEGVDTERCRKRRRV